MFSGMLAVHNRLAVSAFLKMETRRRCRLNLITWRKSDFIMPVPGLKKHKHCESKESSNSSELTNLRPVKCSNPAGSQENVGSVSPDLYPSIPSSRGGGGVFLPLPLFFSRSMSIGGGGNCSHR